MNIIIITLTIVICIFGIIYNIYLLIRINNVHIFLLLLNDIIYAYGLRAVKKGIHVEDPWEKFRFIDTLEIWNKLMKFPFKKLRLETLYTTEEITELLQN